MIVLAVTVSGSISLPNVSATDAFVGTPVADAAGTLDESVGAAESVVVPSVNDHWSYVCDIGALAGTSGAPAADFTDVDVWSTYVALDVRLPPPVRENTMKRRSAPKPIVCPFTKFDPAWNHAESVNDGFCWLAIDVPTCGVDVFA